MAGSVQNGPDQFIADFFEQAQASASRGAVGCGQSQEGYGRLV